MSSEIESNSRRYEPTQRGNTEIRILPTWPSAKRRASSYARGPGPAGTRGSVISTVFTVPNSTAATSLLVLRWRDECVNTSTASTVSSRRWVASRPPDGRCTCGPLTSRHSRTAGLGDLGSRRRPGSTGPIGCGQPRPSTVMSPTCNAGEKPSPIRPSPRGPWGPQVLGRSMLRVSDSRQDPGSVATLHAAWAGSDRSTGTEASSWPDGRGSWVWSRPPASRPARCGWSGRGRRSAEPPASSRYMTSLLDVRSSASTNSRAQSTGTTVSWSP